MTRLVTGRVYTAKTEDVHRREQSVVFFDKTQLGKRRFFMLSAVQIAGLFVALILLCIYLKIVEGGKKKEGLGKADKGNCLGKLQSPVPDPPRSSF